MDHAMSESLDNPYAHAALAYRAAGWVGTLPLPYGSKWPPPEGTTGGEGRWPSTAEIEGWRARERPQNVALRLPPNVVALDIDEPTAFTALVATLGGLPPTWRVYSGGARIGHLLFRLPPGVVSTGWSAPCPGVDLLRYGHRYSVVWPSLHPSGSTYVWARPDGFYATDGEIPSPGELAELPGPWVEHLAGGRGSASSSANKPAVERGLLETGTRILAAGDGGPGHQQVLFSHASSMRSRGVPEGEAAVVIRHRAAHDCVPPWAGPDDPWDAVAHAYKYPEGAPAEPGLSLARPLAALSAGELEGDGQAVGVIGSAAPPEGAKALEFVDWLELWQTPPGTEWAIPGLVPVGAGAVLYSAPGLGKSLLALEIAVAVSRGAPVLGEPCTPRTVLYVDHENDPRGDVVRRLKNMGLGPLDLTNLRYLSFPDMAALDSPRGGAELLAAALDVGAALVVIDTVSRAVAGEENSNDTWNAFYRNTGRALKLNGIACLRLDHSGKDAERGQRGGSAKSGDVDVVWKFERGERAFEFVLSCEKDRTPIALKEFGVRREINPLRHEKFDIPTKEAQRWAKLRAMWAAATEAGMTPDATAVQLRAVFAAAGVRDTRKHETDFRAAWREQSWQTPGWLHEPSQDGSTDLTLVPADGSEGQKEVNNHD